MARRFTVGIDASRSYRQPMTGTERYSRRIIEHLLTYAGHGWDYRLYFNEPPPSNAVTGCSEVRAMPARRLWTHHRLSRELRANPVDLLFVPSHVLPIYHPRCSVVTIHDLGYIYEPEAHTVPSRLQLQFTTRWNVRQASHLIAISDSTRHDLIDHLGVPEAKITVIRHGIDQQFRLIVRERIEQYRRAAQLPDQFILYLGTIQPRKNLVRLIAAFERLARQDADLHLVLAGRPGWKSDPIVARVTESPFADRIRFPGYIPEEQLPLLYSCSTTVAIPSLYEGFGLPALEAMACGVPVVMSSRGALPELAGGDAEVVDPTQIEEIADAIASTVARRYDEGLVALRVEHASQFTWTRAAQETRDVLWHALNQ